MNASSSRDVSGGIPPTMGASTPSPALALIGTAPPSVVYSILHVRSAQDDAAPTHRGHLFPRRGRTVRARRYRFQIGIHRRDSHSPRHAGNLGCPHGADGERTFQRAARSGRVLRLGLARHGAFLGVSGSLAVAHGQRLRCGHLPHPVRQLSRTPAALDDRRRARYRSGGRAGGRRGRLESAGRQIHRR